MRNLHYPIDLKLRAGYGLSGNLAAIDCYNSLELLKPNGIVYVDGTPTVTIGLIRNANPDLKWEIKKDVQHRYGSFALLGSFLAYARLLQCEDEKHVVSL